MQSKNSLKHVSSKPDFISSEIVKRAFRIEDGRESLWNHDSGAQTAVSAKTSEILAMVPSLERFASRRRPKQKPASSRFSTRRQRTNLPLMKPDIGIDENTSSSTSLFPATQWSLVQRARDKSTVALNTLCDKYRRPFLIWLRVRQRELDGLDPEDLVNGFLGFKLPQQVLQTVSREKGKFRTFVLACLKNYVNDEVTKRNAAMRGGGIEHRSIDETDEKGLAVVEPLSTDAGADEEFDRAWGLAILESAVRKLEEELSRKGHLLLWRRLEPILYEESDAPGYREIAKEFNVATKTLHTAAHRIRQRLKALIRQEIKDTVASSHDFEDELKEFIALFSHPRTV
jgi:DNA-directed RNA polymerase specialized sigma24 family protein